MLAITGTLFAIVLLAYVRHDDFLAIISAIGEWAGQYVEFP